MKGVIFDIKRFAVHDGPGIRTTVFLKGCPLRCSWCHNPESQRFGVEEPAGGGRPPRVGRTVWVEDVVREVERDTAFYDESGGGVTFSGGEPLAQPAFLVEALDRCGRLDIHRAVDTSGYAPRDVLLRVAERTDLFLYDLKLADGVRHLERTGVEADLIHDNLRALSEAETAVQLRIPVVPGITDTADNLAGLKALIETLPHPLPVQFLPYHRAAMDKYPRFGMEPPLPDTPEPTAEQIEKCRIAIGDCGLGN
jgi:pyruvate formate lyase activating enzyme